VAGCGMRREERECKESWVASGIATDLKQGAMYAEMATKHGAAKTQRTTKQ